MLSFRSISNTHKIYNEIYGTGYTQGTNRGDCYDSSMPAVKYNTDHEFWVANDIPVTDPDFEGCGFSVNGIVDGEAGVTALGGWFATADISFAIRAQEAGVFWLLDHDWQDTNQGGYTDDSRYFMGALISGGTFAEFEPTEATPVPSMTLWGMLLLVLSLTFLARRRIVG